MVAPPRVWWDWVLVGVLGGVALGEGLVRDGLEARGLSVIVCVGLVGTLPWRRVRPLLMVGIAFGVCLVASVVAGVEFPHQDVLVYLLLLPFAAVRWGSGREAVLSAAIVFGKVGVSALLGHVSPGDTLAGVVILFAAMALGAAFRYRSRARARELDQVKLLERERLARDLHDTVAHHVSAMAIRAQAGIATAPTDPDAAVDALKLIDAEAARALDEMRGMVRILRAEEPPDLSPGPRLADVEGLAAHGHPVVDVEVVGDGDDLPSPVGAAVFRLAQEAVTNARRHARHATRVEVRVVVDDKAVHVRVSDDGEPGPPRRSSGYGIPGMVERASMLGGTCAAGPNPDRGWTVTAMLPRVAT